MFNNVSKARHEEQLAYVLLRAFVGLDFFGHGYARIFTGTFLPGFAAGMQHSMATAPLSPDLVLWVGYAIPIVELFLGVFLLLGFFTGTTLRAAFALMFVLLFGVAMKQDWSAAAQQMIYALALFVLLFLRERYDMGWRRFLRAPQEGVGPVAVPSRVANIATPEATGPLGRS
jgi:thiosulfate dehydrogenase [quinone] large subunit